MGIFEKFNEKVVEKFSGKCQYCGRSIANGQEAFHGPGVCEQKPIEKEIIINEETTKDILPKLDKKEKKPVLDKIEKRRNE